jgi:hypothetical protein
MVRCEVVQNEGYGACKPVARHGPWRRRTWEIEMAGRKAAPKPPSHTHAREAGKGRYVTHRYAREHPGTTVEEKDKRRRKKR